MTLKMRRWCVTVRPFRAGSTSYSAGGKRTPGPWWALTVRWLGEVILSHDRTIFGWDNQP